MTNFTLSLKNNYPKSDARLAGLQAAEQDYYITAKYVLDLANRAYNLFESSEVEERRQLIKLVLSNLRIEGENVLWELQKPFDLIVKTTDSKLWRQTLGTLRTFRWSNLKQRAALLQQAKSIF